MSTAINILLGNPAKKLYLKTPQFLHSANIKYLIKTPATKMASAINHGFPPFFTSFLSGRLVLLLRCLFSLWC